MKKGAAPKSEPHPLSKSETAPDLGAEKSMTDDDTTTRQPGVFHASDNKEQQKQPTEYKIEETQGKFSYYLWIHLLMAVKHVLIVSRMGNYPVIIVIVPGDTVFKAKSLGADIEDAETVAETHDTEVEKPIDMEEAEVVEDEEKEEIQGEGEIEGEGDTDKVCCKSGCSVRVPPHTCPPHLEPPERSQIVRWS